MRLRLRCGKGHPSVAYGPDDETHWAPATCPKCASPWIDAEKIADLSGWPDNRYYVRIRARKGVPSQEQIVSADRYERRQGELVFLTGSHIVARFRRSVADPVLIY